MKKKTGIGLVPLLILLAMLGATSYVGYMTIQNAVADKRALVVAADLKAKASGIVASMRQMQIADARKVDTKKLAEFKESYSRDLAEVHRLSFELKGEATRVNQQWLNIDIAIDEVIKAAERYTQLESLQASLMAEAAKAHTSALELLREVTANPGFQVGYPLAVISATGELIVSVSNIPDSVSTRTLTTFVSNYNAANVALQKSLISLSDGIKSNAVPRSRKVVAYAKNVSATKEVLTAKVQEVEAGLKQRIEASTHLEMALSDADEWLRAQEQLVLAFEGLDSKRSINITLLLILGGVTATAIALMLIYGSSMSKTEAEYAQEESSAFKRLAETRSRELSGLLDDLQRVERGDLTVTLDTSGDSTGKIAEAVNRVIKTLKDVIQQAQGMATNLSAASEQSAQTAKQVDQGRSEQTRAIEGTYDLSRSVDEELDGILQQSKLTSHSASAAQGEVESGTSAMESAIVATKQVSSNQQQITNKMKSMVDTVQRLGTIADEISGITQEAKMISINLGLLSSDAEGQLSKRITSSAEMMQELTKTIKSYAAEVSKSAQKVTSEAKETQNVVESSINATEEMLTLSDKAGAALQGISSEADKLLGHARTVEAAVNNVKANSTQIIDSVQSVQSRVVDGAAASEQTARAITEVATQSNRLMKTVENFRTEKVA